MFKIFISYGRADGRDLAIRLRDDLRALNFDVWLDVDQIPGGASWSLKIEKAVDHCDAMLALMSKASRDSEWCLAEQLRARRKVKPLIPVKVQTDADPPLHLEHLNYIDFSTSERYDEAFRDLLSDISALQAFTPKQADSVKSGDDSPFKGKRGSASKRSYRDEKRNAQAFRRTLSKLRSEDLGARHWWPYFLFYFADVHSVVDILSANELASAFALGKDFNSKWDKYVRLYFRPRTPDLYRNEGFRPAASFSGKQYCPMPVYLLFDMESVICHPDSRFSDGDLLKTEKTYKTPTNFRELPFDQIYHDSWFLPDEGSEIISCRKAQVVIPDQIGLEALQFIWVRSPAEYETLRALLPDEVWQRWRDKITARTDYHLFNRKWVYVEEAFLMADEMLFRFNRCEYESNCGPFMVSVDVEYENGTSYTWQEDAYTIGDDLAIEVPQRDGAYTVQMLLDGDLAYAGRFVPEEDVF